MKERTFTQNAKSYLSGLMVFFCLLMIPNLGLGQCTTSCSTDNAGAGETSCIDIGVPTGGTQIGLDAINGSIEPQIIAALMGNTLVDELDNCCAALEDGCMSVTFEVPASGGCFIIDEVNNLGSGSVLLDCVDAEPLLGNLTTISSGTHEFIFCPPGGSGSKRLDLVPIFTSTVAFTSESCEDGDDGTITVSSSVSNSSNGAASTIEGDITYSLDGVGGTTANTSGVFENLAPGTYTVVVYDSGDPAPITCFSSVTATIEEGTGDCCPAPTAPIGVTQN